MPASNSRLTPYVVVCWIFAAFGGLMFGYAIGISGGVTAMDDFLKKFFPAVHERIDKPYENNYCKYNDPVLQLFTSSLYLAALIVSFGASKVCTRLGRRPTIRFASLVFIVGAVVSGSAPNKFVLILGRIFFGIGAGFSNEHLKSETPVGSPLLIRSRSPRHRGAVNVLFQFFITIGILIANLVNYVASHIHPHGWRLALGLAGLPGLVLLVGSTSVIQETPSSLIERGHEPEGRSALQRIRGLDNDVEAELQQIKQACEVAKRENHSFRKLLKRASVPPLVISVLIQVFQQFTGINAVMFYSPVLFRTMGFENNGLLLSAVVTGVVNVLSTVAALAAINKVGRRKMLLLACAPMLLCMVGIGAILQVHLKPIGAFDRGLAFLVVVLICLFVMSFAWSWGPLGWLIPSEIFPLEARTAGFALSVGTNMLFTFIVGQCFLSMLCHMRATIFFFLAAWIVIMGLFTMFLLPETKGVSVDDTAERVWRSHPAWNRFMPREGTGVEMT